MIFPATRSAARPSRRVSPVATTRPAPDGPSPWWVFAWTALAGLALAAAPVGAQEFRVDNQVFVGKETRPVVTGVTLFTERAIYDSTTVGGVEEVVMLDPDPANRRFVLCDTQRQVKTTLPTLRAYEFAYALRNSIQNADGVVNPRFETSGDATSVTLASAELTYSAQGERPRIANAAERYAMFADWSAYLNTIRPPNPPPFGRLDLDQALLERGLVPREIHRSLSRKGKVEEVRSTHTYVWRLSEKDLARVAQIQNLLVTCTLVDIEVYLGIKPVAPADGK